ncbi:GNAT family N-acetyltransferase [Providencia vermicola]|uniref:GNAT family N-acetyltransferase n=1 Tax=Providencia TaxID=586 RepID=UPI0012B6248E|nr:MULTISPECIES: GNAT family N-acetyltransferase [Providencia]ELR5141067.1 GNAT family N-acetyltransferase [Providencia stuartii]MTB41730.1 GNAT family N-acetyltransferase [Providencia sp. wls1949]MTC09202.1 GNAT family N-acetyltransferase [Providencia sp. wls1948]WER23576.1 GNAT family N-acetyltransferase [Providencia stuartii]WER27697.1 GNAT family N-acetyltransferase [Providencia stuartii]
MNLNFRNLFLDDINEITDLYIQTYQAPPWNELYPSAKPVKEFISNHLKNNYFLGYVAILDSRIVAVSIGFQKPWPEGMEYYIDDFFVGYDYQNRGVGSLFMAYIREDMRAKNLNAILLHTEHGYPAESFYIKNGFERHENMLLLSTRIPC